jgi:uncharacterized protein YutE (UPF0331/DUF86 family)
VADPAVVSRKLSQIEQYYGELKTKQQLSKEEFLDDITERRAIERMFQNAIQACIDLATHIATAAFEYEGKASKEAVEVLGEHEVLSDATVSKLTDAVGFRNILAHQYGDVSPEKVYEYLQHELAIYEDVSREIAEWFRQQES